VRKTAKDLEVSLLKIIWNLSHIKNKKYTAWPRLRKLQEFKKSPVLNLLDIVGQNWQHETHDLVTIQDTIDQDFE
jgi:hypothetical protein